MSSGAATRRSFQPFLSSSLVRSTAASERAKLASTPPPQVFHRSGGLSLPIATLSFVLKGSFWSTWRSTLTPGYLASRRWAASAKPSTGPEFRCQKLTVPVMLPEAPLPAAAPPAAGAVVGWAAPVPTPLGLATPPDGGAQDAMARPAAANAVVRKTCRRVMVPRLGAVDI